MATKLKNASGEYVTIQAGESANLTGTLKDATGATLLSVSTFTLTLYDNTTGAIINSRKDQDVNNANGGTVTSGNYTVELDANDTAAVGDIAENKDQIRVARLTFTYNDGDSVRTGIEEFTFKVERLKETVGTGSGSNDVTLTVTDASSNPVAEATVYVTSDLAGQEIVAGPVITNVSGVTPTLKLNVGTFYQWATHDGYSFTNPVKFTVS